MHLPVSVQIAIWYILAGFEASTSVSETKPGYMGCCNWQGIYLRECTLSTSSTSEPILLHITGIKPQTGGGAMGVESTSQIRAVAKTQSRTLSQLPLDDHFHDFQIAIGDPTPFQILLGDHDKVSSIPIMTALPLQYERLWLGRFSSDSP